MKSITYITGFIALFLSCSLVSAQIRIGAHFQNEVVQRSDWNPAAMQDVSAQIMMPGISVFGGSSAFTINEILTDIPGTDSMEISFERILDVLDEENLLRSDFEYDWIGFAVGLEPQGLQIGLSFKTKLHSQVSYDKDLLGLLIQGNAAYIGEEIEIGPQISAMAYSDFGISVAKKIGDKFQVGARFHYLNGSIGINTPRHQASLLTSPEYYQLEMGLDYELNAAFPAVNVLDSIQQGVVNTENIAVNVGPSQNHGFALDFSALFRPLENMEISAGVNGLGSITYSQNAQRFISRGNFSFDGVEVQNTENEPLFERLVNLDFSAVADSIREAYEVSISEENFTMATPLRIFVAANYAPVENLQLGVTYQQESWQGQTHATMALYGGLKLNHGFSAGLSYANNSRFGGFLGLHAHANVGPFQFYSSVDNLNSFVNPLRSKAVIFRFGTNILIGKWWKRETPPGDVYVAPSDY